MTKCWWSVNEARNAKRKSSPLGGLVQASLGALDDRVLEGAPELDRLALVQGHDDRCPVGMESFALSYTCRFLSSGVGVGEVVGAHALVIGFLLGAVVRDPRVASWFVYWFVPGQRIRYMQV